MINSEKIKIKAKELGFSSCGISEAKELHNFENNLQKLLDQKLFADMNWMQNNIEKRGNPCLLEEGSKSVISVLYNYYPNKIQREDTYQISKYAYGKDYHEIMKKKLWILLDYIKESCEIEVIGRAFVDSAPVAERIWAVESGLGWIGKNSLLLTTKGSFFFVGEIIINTKLEYDKPQMKNYCGSCTKCIDSCPTKAIISPKTVDSNKCISYQTIENKGDIDKTLKGKFENYIYGCDICQDVCPWNKSPIPHGEEEFEPHPAILTNNKKDWENLTQEKFSEIFKKSAVKRTKYKGLMRNIEWLQ